MKVRAICDRCGAVIGEGDYSVKMSIRVGSISIDKADLCCDCQTFMKKVWVRFMTITETEE